MLNTAYKILTRLILVLLVALISILTLSGLLLALDEYVYPITLRTTSGIRPLPDVIYMRPQKSRSMIDGNSISYSYLKDEALIDKEALKIVRKNGKYYWKSQEGQRLYMATGVFKQGLSGTAPRTIFIASDASAVIYVAHDTCNREHLCGSCTAYYQEYRLNEMQLFSGHNGFFPPRPEDWCKPLSGIRPDPWERPWFTTFTEWLKSSNYKEN